MPTEGADILSVAEIPHAEAVRERLGAARSVVVLTGAGISAESGLSTFRDPGGLWRTYRPEELANESAFRRDPALVQGWYLERRRRAEAARPNPAHLALARLEQMKPDFLLVTQNVDGLHARAGNTRIVELHGSITSERCIDCGRPASPNFEGADGLRRCGNCSGLLRPGVVWFGEPLPEGAIEAASRAARKADVFLSVGTSSVVYPAARLPIEARQHGAFVVEVNTEPSAISDYLDATLLGRAGTILPWLVRTLPDGGTPADPLAYEKLHTT